MTKGLLKEFSKAQVSSLVSTGCDFMVTAMVFLLTDHVVISTASGAFAGGAINCSINYTWTFNGSRRSKMGVAWRYVLVWMGSMLLNTFGTEYGVKTVEHISAQMGSACAQSLTMVMAVKAVVAVAVAVFWNFTMQKYFVYRKQSPSQPSPEGVDRTTVKK